MNDLRGRKKRNQKETEAKKSGAAISKCYPGRHGCQSHQNDGPEDFEIEKMIRKVHGHAKLKRLRSNERPEIIQPGASHGEKTKKGYFWVAERRAKRNRKELIS